MKYMLFCYDTYYPSGGMGDFCGAFETVEQAKAKAETLGWDYAEIVDKETFMEVLSGHQARNMNTLATKQTVWESRDTDHTKDN